MNHLRRIALYPLVLLVFCGAAFPAHAVRPSYFFDLRETRNGELAPFPKWTSVLSRFNDQQGWPEDECGKRTYFPCRLKEWKTLLETLRGKPLPVMMEEVNRYINQYPYVIDQVNWGMVDYWETPYELISVNGDCEDYAIAKYYSLRYLGVPEDRLRVMIVQDYNLGGIIHAILGVYDESGRLSVLDNQIKQVVSANRIYHYRPIYGVNEKAWWAYHVQ